MSLEKHPTLSKESSLEKLLSSLSTEAGQQELKQLVQKLSDVGDISFEVTFPSAENLQEVHPDFSTLVTKNEQTGMKIREVITELVAQSRQYLRRPMITDTFPDHAARRRWFSNPPVDSETMGRYLPFQQANKLRFNNIGEFGNKIVYLRLLLNPKRGGVEWDRKDEILAAFNDYPDFEDYGEMDEETKLQRMRALDAFCERFIAAACR